MKTVYLHGKLGKRFGKKWKLNVSSAREAYFAIEANCEGFFEYVFEAEKKGIHYVSLGKNPKNIKTEDDFRKNLIDTKSSEMHSVHQEIHVISTAHGSGVIMPLIFVGGVVSGGLTLAGTILVGLAVGFAIQSLMKPPKPPNQDKKDPITTKSYLISGGRGRQAQGIPVPIGYGTLKIGNVNIAQSKKSKQLKYLKQSSKTLESYAELEFLDLLSEGPIYGFVDVNGASVGKSDICKAIYLNDVVVQNPDGTFNYILNETMDNLGMPRFSLGEDTVESISDEVSSVTEYDMLVYGPRPYVNTEFSVSEAIDNNAKIVAHSVSSIHVNRVTLSFKTELSQTNFDNGATDPNSMRFAILIQRSGGDINVLNKNSGCIIVSPLQKGVAIDLDDHDARPFSGAGKGNSAFTVYGVASSAYQFDITIDFEPILEEADRASGVKFKVIKLFPEYDPSVKGNNYGGVGRVRNLQLAHVQETIKERLLYPNTAMIKLVTDSKNFSSMPQRQYKVKLKKVLIPSNYDPVNRKYEGAWNGLFKGQDDSQQSIHSITDSNKYWTDNPAWIFFDMLSNPRYGVGKYGLEEENIDKWQLYKIAKYCDELVETDYFIETNSRNPRSFSCDNIVTTYEYDDGPFGSRTKKIPDVLRIVINAGEYKGEFVTYETNEGEEVPTNFKIEDASQVTIDQTIVDRFVKEFGSNSTFAGKKIAFFIHQPSGNVSDKEKAYRSVVRDGEIIIENLFLQACSVLEHSSFIQ